MSPDEGITQEEMEVFLQEADEQLQLLDEDLIELEKDGTNAALLQEIFRAAHTIKGSSAMAGFTQMSQVAHAMETILDKLRNNNLIVSTEVIDSLLYGLDALKLLREEIVTGENKAVDTTTVKSRLESIGQKQKEADISEEDSVSESDRKIQEKIQRAQKHGQQVYRLDVHITQKSDWAAVRCFQVLSELSSIGEVMETNPPREEIESGRCGQFLKVLFLSDRDENNIRTCLNSVPDLEKLEIGFYGTHQPSDNKPIQADRVEHEAPIEHNNESRKPANIAQTVRVDISLLDTLMNLVGEMVIDRNRIRQISRSLATRMGGDDIVESLETVSLHIMKLVDELQDSVLKARMLPIGTVFNSLPRLVRDLAQKAGKKIRFVASGHETEFDRTLIEQIRDPLIHLIRNSVDHGIELPEKRLKAGKLEEGTLYLSACQEQNHIIITVEDDGTGINLEKVRSGAIRKGVVSSEEAARLSDSEVINLIFTPGFSTAEKVTEVSGRGVGMDVVRTNVEGMGGSVHIESMPGEGCRIIIRLPLTLATINGLLVTAADTYYIVPMMSVVEVLQLKPDEVKTITGKEVITVRKDILPLLRLKNRFGQLQKQNGKGNVVVIIKDGNRSVGLVVDSVIEPQDTVVKPLGQYVGNVESIAGATILGDGEVALILDTATMIKTFSEKPILA